MNLDVCYTDDSEEVGEAGEGDNEGSVTYNISSDVRFTSSKISR